MVLCFQKMTTQIKANKYEKFPEKMLNLYVLLFICFLNEKKIHKMQFMPENVKIIFFFLQYKIELILSHKNGENVCCTIQFAFKMFLQLL